MTPKTKAFQLYTLFSRYTNSSNDTKDTCLTCINEVTKVIYGKGIEEYKYWDNVREEILKLK